MNSKDITICGLVLLVVILGVTTFAVLKDYRAVLSVNKALTTDRDSLLVEIEELKNHDR